jgi:5-methyltetrahydropteroyltriglutamate--homocysteine methyltransferase
MAILTTCIGAYPKPEYVPIVDWFQHQGGLAGSAGDITRKANKAMEAHNEEDDALFVKATKAAIGDQVGAGIDVPTDGEQRRENYIHYHCRHLNGFDFENLTNRVLRDGAYEAELPTITGEITPKGNNFLNRDFEIANQFTDRPVKITVPGPMTIMDTTVNKHYDDEKQLACDLADALNFEIKALVDAGCKFIQVDEPVFARNVDRALDFGIECLDRCFHGVPDEVSRVMHMCCGYPEKLDDEDYKKAQPSSYFQLADGLDQSSINQVSLEDAHRYNDLRLLEKFAKTTVIFGAVAIADSHVETVDAIKSRLMAALQHIDRERLVAAPDCGLAILGRDLARIKLANLCNAAKLV